jgi:hypothetical protein
MAWFILERKLKVLKVGCFLFNENFEIHHRNRLISFVNRMCSWRCHCNCVWWSVCVSLFIPSLCELKLIWCVDVCLGLERQWDVQAFWQSQPILMSISENLFYYNKSRKSKPNSTVWKVLSNALNILSHQILNEPSRLTWICDEGKKIYLSGQIVDPKDGTLHAEATGLFIKFDWERMTRSSTQ